MAEISENDKINISINCLDIPKDARAPPPVTANNFDKIDQACEDLIIFTDNIIFYHPHSINILFHHLNSR